jgi:calcineurin-like phosphoesterase family protein
MAEYFTADPHLGHPEIIEHCRRPFKNEQRMTRETTKRYNSVVGHDDTCYIVGDLALAGPTRYHFVVNILEKLNGTKILILGNHDEIRPLRYVDAGFQSVHTSLILERNGYKLVLAHDPSIWNVVSNWKPLPIFIHGHIHNVWKSVVDKRMVNVGVDQWDFYPVSLEQILDELKLPYEAKE